eukprot:5270920-Amphidinium_carterae.1
MSKENDRCVSSGPLVRQLQSGNAHRAGGLRNQRVKAARCASSDFLSQKFGLQCQLWGAVHLGRSAA